MWQRNELAWVAMGQLLAVLGGFVAIKIFTNMMGPEGYGQLALGVAIAGLVNMFVYGPLGQTVSRFFSVYRERGELGVYFSALKKTHFNSGLFLSLCAGVMGVLAHLWFGADWGLLVTAAIFFGIVSGYNSSFLFLHGAARQRKIVALHQGAEAWLRPALGVLALILLGNSAPIAFLGFITGTLLVVTSQWLYSSRIGSIRSHWNAGLPDGVSQKAASREFISFAGPLSIFAAFTAISVYADRWVLQGLFGVNEVGIYVALYQIGNAPIALLYNSVIRFVEPIIFARAGTMTNGAQAANANRMLYKVIVLFSIPMFPIVAAAYFFGEPIVRIMTNTTFSEHAGVLWALTIGLCLFYIGQLLTTKGMNHHRPGIYTIPKALQACSFLLFTYFLAKLYGLPGVAVAICLSSFLYVAMVILVNRRLQISTEAK